MARMKVASMTDDEIDDIVETMRRRDYDDEEIERFLAKHPHSWDIPRGAQ